jgi:hypothetical protein
MRRLSAICSDFILLMITSFVAPDAFRTVRVTWEPGKSLPMSSLCRFASVTGWPSTCSSSSPRSSCWQLKAGPPTTMDSMTLPWNITPTVAREENLELNVAVGTESRSLCSSCRRSSHAPIDASSDEGAGAGRGGAACVSAVCSVHSLGGLAVPAADARLLSCAAAPARYRARYGFVVPARPAASSAEVGDCCAIAGDRTRAVAVARRARPAGPGRGKPLSAPEASHGSFVAVTDPFIVGRARRIEPEAADLRAKYTAAAHDRVVPTRSQCRLCSPERIVHQFTPKYYTYSKGRLPGMAAAETASLTPLTMADLRSIVGNPRVVLLRRYTKIPPYVEAGTVGLLYGICGSDATVSFPGRPGWANPPPEDIAFAPDEKTAAAAAAAENEAAADTAAAAKALQDAEDAQLAAAIAASLEISEAVAAPAAPAMPPAVGRVKRWGEGLEAPAAGSRNFLPQGFEVTLDVSEAIARFGHSASHVAQIMEAGRVKASTSPTPLASAHAAALYAYTEETLLYGTLNYTMRTPHTPNTPTDTELKRYCDYIVHTERALSSLPTHVSEVLGKVYRGIKILLNPDIYALGKRITWQAFSSSTKKQTATLEFVSVLPGRKLSGSLFVIDSITAKDIRHFSTFPSEEEVLFPPNSQFKVEKLVTSEQEKRAELDQLCAYDMTDLDVYVLKQIA